MKRNSLLFSALGIIALACSSTVLFSKPTPSLPAPTDTPTSELAPTIAPTPMPTTEPPIGFIGSETTLASLFEKVNPGVVAIYSYLRNGNIALGSGFVVDTDGHIVSNMHVIQDAASIEVDFPSGFKAMGSVIGQDPNSDLAVIKVDAPAEELHPLTLGDSSLVKVGETVVAIGNPFGFNSTLTMGIVSAIGRMGDSLTPSGDSNFFEIADMIQTDAAINPGNSGGPLINLRGEVIGVNRSIVSNSTDASGNAVNSGLGFAISSNIVKRVLPSLIANGKYEYPYLGMKALSITHLTTQDLLSLPYSYGVYVTGVVSGGPAAQAGLRAGTKVISSLSSAGIKGGGDLILAVDNVKVINYAELLGYLILNKVPGDTVVFSVARDGTTVDISVTLGSRS